MRKPIALALCMLASLAATGCGRTALQAVSPPAVAMKTTMPLDLPSAVQAARAAVTPTAEVHYAAAFGATERGRLVDSVRSGWVIGFVEGGKATVVGVNFLGETRAAKATLPAGVKSLPIRPEAMPALDKVVPWARQAGLPKAATYQVVWVADPKGGLVGVSQSLPPGAGATDEAEDPDRALVLLDAATGKAILPVVKDEAPAAEPAAPEAAEDVALTALSIGRGR